MVPGGTSSYRYVADGSLAESSYRDAMARLRSPRALVSLVVVGLVLGVSLSAIAADVPDDLGTVLPIGVAWGLLWVAAVFLVVPPLVKVVNGRIMAPLFSEGSVTEVELGPESLLIRRPTKTRSVPYRAIFRVRARGPLLRVEVRGRVRAELLPGGLLPDEAIEFIRARSRGTRPATSRDHENLDRELVVPANWAAHVAAVVTGATLRSGRFWIRFALVLPVSAMAAALAGREWTLLAPVLAVLTVTFVYVGTRRAVASVLPPGSLASTKFLEDRLISSNVGGVREIPFQDVRSHEVHGDVVLLGLVTGRGWLAIARDLFPDSQLERLPR